MHMQQPTTLLFCGDSHSNFTGDFKTAFIDICLKFAEHGDQPGCAERSSCSTATETGETTQAGTGKG